jgi:hypothetical protein
VIATAMLVAQRPVTMIARKAAQRGRVLEHGDTSDCGAGRLPASWADSARARKLRPVEARLMPGRGDERSCCFFYAACLG